MSGSRDPASEAKPGKARRDTHQRLSTQRGYALATWSNPLPYPGARTVNLTTLTNLGTALHEAGTKITTAVRELTRREDEASKWMQRFIYREIEERTRTRGPAYWDAQFPGLSPPERAQMRIQRMLTRATVAGIAAAGGATTAELMSLVGSGAGALAGFPLGLVSVGAEMVYTTALQIDLAFDLASIYGVPYAHDDVGEISTLLALALGVDLVREPTRHDKPATDGETKPWRVLRQMQRDDFSQRLGREVVQQSVLRNVIPVVGVLVSAAWNQVVLRRFANHVHTAVRQRLGILHACSSVRLGEERSARAILDGAWLIATADGDIGHQEALALATLIDSLTLPERIAVHDASFSDDEEAWFATLSLLEPAAQPVLIDVLALIASADGVFTTPERRFVRRVACALDRDVDLGAIELLVTRMRQGEMLPSMTQLSAQPALATA
jgi:tellurite resistance protein